MLGSIRARVNTDHPPSGDTIKVSNDRAGYFVAFAPVLLVLRVCRGSLATGERYAERASGNSFRASNESRARGELVRRDRLRFASDALAVYLRYVFVNVGARSPQDGRCSR
ncbi:hypothetical protein EVAR_94131_1 [Eumeta japonica]|uniref:Uncharacterized protein n=1 Tax=Eumeta variegata TaxID=151549 RepID=A0A4C1U6T8_EUMVA|nr:hypothetical protein EVAR_94131_1 [Eumeta japonica]